MYLSLDQRAPYISLRGTVFQKCFLFKSIDLKNSYVCACDFVFVFIVWKSLRVFVCYLHLRPCLRIWKHFLILNDPCGRVVLCSFSALLMQILDSQLCLHTNRTPAADPQQTLVSSYMAVVLLRASQAVWIHSKHWMCFWELRVELWWTYEQLWASHEWGACGNLMN